MRPYGIIDMHCDTLTECKYTNTGNPDTLNDPKRVLSLSNVPAGVKWAQLFAIWIQDEYTGPAAMKFFDACADSFYRQAEKFSERLMPCRSAADIEKAWSENKLAGILAIENGSVLGGKLENVAYLYERGVRCMTVVWNGENEIASGNRTENGFSAFGRQLIPEMEKTGILVDVSHLNDRGFYELLDIARKPFIATHSNVRSICSHKRNLTEDMIKEMIYRNCLIGLNYYTSFIDNDGDSKNIDRLFAHVDRFMELGAERNLALGSDFDGSTLPEYMNSPSKVAEFYDYLISRGYRAETADGIFYKNAMNFLRENIG